MPEVPAIQLAHLALAIFFFAAAGAASVARLRADSRLLRGLRSGFLWAGVVMTAIVLIWHSMVRGGSWLPLEDNFTALVWLGLILALLVAYIQYRRPITGLDWFVMPVVILLLLCAAFFGRLKPHAYVQSTWFFIHRATAYLGAIGFVIAGAAGLMYLIQNQRLRSKHASPSTAANLASLERLEHTTLTAVSIGFAFLTVGLITGLLLYRADLARLGPHWWATPKVLLAFSVWFIYAIVLHSPFNPSFRGRRAALLSVVGLLLMLGTLIAVQFMPGRTS